MTNKTVLIVGKAGPQGKTTLKKALIERGYSAITLGEVIEAKNEEALHNGLCNGFIVLNFTYKPFIEDIDLSYKMPEDELEYYMCYIDLRAGVADICLDAD